MAALYLIMKPFFFFFFSVNTEAMAYMITYGLSAAARLIAATIFPLSFSFHIFWYLLIRLCRRYSQHFVTKSFLLQHEGVK